MNDAQNKQLKLRALVIENFKGVKQLSLDLDPKLTLIVGKNGVGKTSILEAIRFVYSHLFESISVNGNLLNIENARVGREKITKGESDLLFSSTFDLPKESEISPNSVIEGQFNVLTKIYTVFSFEHGFDISSKPIKPANTKQRARENFSRFLSPGPLVVFYDQNRTFPLHGQGQRGNLNAQSVFSSSKNASAGSVADFSSWYDLKDQQEARQVRDGGDGAYRDTELNAIRKIAKQILKFDDIRYDTVQNKVMLYQAGNALGIDELSSGERVFFVLAADLARRLILAYPEKTLSECEAVVLIDEIELHLHPTWQREIISNLQALFSSCQFVVTTHSPQVVGSVSSQNVRLISKNSDGLHEVFQPKASKGRDSNYILETILDSSDRDPKVEVLISEFENDLRLNEFASAEMKLAKINRRIEGDSATVAILTSKLQRKKNERVS